MKFLHTVPLRAWSCLICMAGRKKKANYISSTTRLIMKHGNQKEWRYKVSIQQQQYCPWNGKSWKWKVNLVWFWFHLQTLDSKTQTNLPNNQKRTFRRSETITISTIKTRCPKNRQCNEAQGHCRKDIKDVNPKKEFSLPLQSAIFSL